MLKFNYHHLYYFKTIATEGSVSKAAAKLRLGQPTLSMQLKQFEEYLGIPLFERKNRSLILTEMGRVVLNYANEIFRLGDEMMDTLKDLPTSRKVQVQIGALDSIPKAIIAEVMKAALAEKDCQLSVFEGMGSDLMDDLAEHRLDLVISNAAAPSYTEKRLYSKSLMKMPLVVVGASQFAQLQKNFPRSLSEQKFILPTAHSRVRHDFEHFLEVQKLRINLLAETQDTSLLKSLAVNGQGLTVIAAPAVNDFLESGSLVVIGEMEDYFEEIWLIALQRKIQNPVAAFLLNEFKFTSLSRNPFV